eukprot:TRINITY_DN1048_c0_g3_i1.p1 TRINITY_DN1048_c0_g3~~TRINITY_DN1048_c0_g3_i1.p1  ORF type:complete len:255 (+),score=88.69 TRINITY_DN1048_c0_g3_i1:156-920(+)
MNKTILFLIFCIMIIFVAKAAEDVQTDEIVEDIHTQQFKQPEGEQVQKDQMDPKEFEKKKQEMSQITMSCVILSKYMLHHNQQEVQAVLTANKDKKKDSAHNKLLMMAIEVCSSTLNFDLSSKFIAELSSKSLDFNKYAHIYATFDWDKLKDPATFSTKLTKNQKVIAQFTKEFEKMMEEQEEKKKQQEEEEQYSESSRDISIGGFNFNIQNKALQIGILLFLLAAIVIIVMLFLKKVLTPHEIITKGKKPKKE